MAPVLVCCIFAFFIHSFMCFPNYNNLKKRKERKGKENQNKSEGRRREMQRPEQKTAAGAAEVAKEWLEKSASNSRGLTAEQIWRGGGFVHSVSLSGLSVSNCAGGRVVASFRVPPHLTDEEGNWHAGAIATLIDDVGAAAIMTVIGHIKISVDFSISYFSPAKINEEVEIDARMIEHKGGKGKLTAVTIEVRKKGSASLVAVGRQWMASSRPDQRSNL